MAYYPDFNDPAYGWNQPQYTPTQSPGNFGGMPQPAPVAPPGPAMAPGGGFAQFLDPQVALPIASALIGGRTLKDSLAGGLAVAGPALQDAKKRAAVNAWLKAKSSGDAGALQQATSDLAAADPAMAEGMVSAQIAPHRQWSQIGQTIMGQPTYGFVDPVAGTVTPASGGGQAGGNPDMNGMPGSGNKPIYDTLPKAQQGQVDQLIEGKMPYPSGFQLAHSPYWNTLTAAAEERAQALGVPLDANKYPTRLATQKDFTSGKSAQTVTAGNAAIGHLGQLDLAVNKLGNWNGVPFVNYAYNAAKNAVQNASGDAVDLQTFNAIKSKYSQEITKFYRASGGSDSDINEAMGQLDAARSPAELHATIKAQVGLLESKIGAMQEQWHNGMGAQEPDFPLISKEAQGVLGRIAPNTSGGAPAGAAPPAAASDPISQARDAIARGADPIAVKNRLLKNGINPSGL